MSYTPPRCPDCSVDMEYMELRGQNLHFLSDENRGDVLGKLGVKQRYDVLSYVCPECGLARIYADLDD